MSDICMKPGIQMQSLNFYDLVKIESVKHVILWLSIRRFVCVLFKTVTGNSSQSL